jgi:glycosyltransferase involved in cell wall biosynthesis
MKRVVFCVPTLRKPYQAMLDSLAASVPVIESSGLETLMVSEIGCPYISAARATMLRKALDADADVVVFIDHDVSWRPHDLLRLIETEGDFVLGTYRFKKPEVEYMGQLISGDDGRPIVRGDGAILTYCGPAGFMKVTKSAINTLIQKFPELCYGERHKPHFDLFNHGAHNHVWYGEDYACCRRWREIGGQIWTVPDLNIDHHSADGEVFRGNLHEFLLRQPGGSKAE